MAFRNGSEGRPADWLRARIVLVLSSSSLATAVASAGGCGGSVEDGRGDGTGIGGSQTGTGGAASGTGGNISGSGGSGAAGGAVGNFGGAGGASAGGWGGTGGAAVGGTAGWGGTAGSAGTPSFDGGPNCSLPNRCFTCAELVNQFSWYLDSFSCGDELDSGAGAADAAPDACPDLQGVGNMACEMICTPPVQLGGACCYGVTPPIPACGRPFLVGQELRAAKTIARDDWHAGPALDPLDLDQELGAALAREWETDARLEHASIASFARLTIQLLALGAPSELVALSQAASIDEIEHARLCFALASRYGERAVGPGPLDVQGALPASVDLSVLAAETVREGCVGETLAALLASEQLERAGDSQVRRALARIASDEARHAELSWKIVQFAIANGGDRVARAVASAFEQAGAELERALDAEAARPTAVSQPEAWHAHGRLEARERHALIRAALSDVVRPCADALLSSHA